MRMLVTMALIIIIIIIIAIITTTTRASDSASWHTHLSGHLSQGLLSEERSAAGKARERHELHNVTCCKPA